MARSPDVDPKAVRAQFGRRVQRLARADFLLREIERRMLERLEVVRLQPATILDVGSGLGHGAARLQQRYPQALVVGIELAPALAAAAQVLHGRPARRSLARRLRGWFGTEASQAQGSPLFVAGDAGALPVRAGAVDLVWSNLAWHWFADPRAVADHWYRALRPGGLLSFTSFGVDTLRELQAAGATLPRFPDLHDLGDLLAEAGFAEPVMDTERLTVTWESVETLLSEVHALGGNALRMRRAGLSGRAARRAWIDAIDRLRGPDGRIALGFEIVYGHAWCPARKRRDDGYAPIDFAPRSRQVGRPPG